MSELARLVLLLSLAGAAVTLLGSASIWFNDEERRMRRALRRVLKGPPEAMLTAAGRGRAAGFRFSANAAAVTWDAGAWCLLYRLDELVGAEMMVDSQVVARAFRGEARKALDQTPSPAERVALRFIFDDPRYPDFELELWRPEEAARRRALSASEAVQEANRWITRVEAVLRRPSAARPRPLAVAPAPAAQPEPPPWEDEPDADEALA